MAKEWFGTTPTDRARALLQALVNEKCNCHDNMVRAKWRVDCDNCMLDAIAQLLRDTEAEVRAEVARRLRHGCTDANPYGICTCIACLAIREYVREAKP